MDIPLCMLFSMDGKIDGKIDSFSLWAWMDLKACMGGYSLASKDVYMSLKNPENEVPLLLKYSA